MPGQNTRVRNAPQHRPAAVSSCARRRICGRALGTVRQRSDWNRSTRTRSRWQIEGRYFLIASSRVDSPLQRSRIRTFRPLGSSGTSFPRIVSILLRSAGLGGVGLVESCSSSPSTIPARRTGVASRSSFSRWRLTRFASIFLLNLASLAFFRDMLVHVVVRRAGAPEHPIS